VLTGRLALAIDPCCASLSLPNRDTRQRLDSSLSIEGPILARGRLWIALITHCIRRLTERNTPMAGN